MQNITKKQINDIDVYLINCESCKHKFEGRFWYPSFGSNDGRYCNQCSNLKIIEYQGNELGDCECGGKFNSFELICPNCNAKISDSEKQLAAQFYIIQSEKDSTELTKEKIDDWYEDRLKEGFFNKEEVFLFIQLKKVLLLEEETSEWKYYNPFYI